MALTWTLLILFTLALAAVSVRSIRKHGRYGWARFAAFECALALVFLNRTFWFVDPLVPRQLLSWLFLAASIYLALCGYLQLRKTGQPESEFESTRVLVEIGIYRFIRHPMYASLGFLSIGAMLKHITWLSVGVVLVTWLAVYITAKLEERTNLEKFRNAYRAYMGRTKMFIPWVW